MKGVVVKSMEIGSIRYQVSKSLVAAAGMLRGRLPQGVKYQKTIRKEWEKRSAKAKRG